MKDIQILYVDDKLDNGISSYLIGKAEKQGFRYEELRFKDMESYEDLIVNKLVVESNIIILDSKLFEDGEVEGGKFSGEEARLILKKYYPFMEIIVVTQNEPGESAFNIVQKYNGGGNIKEILEYYDSVLDSRLNSAIEEVIAVREVFKKLNENNDIDSVLKEKISNLIEGDYAFSEMTKEDIDSLVKEVKKLEELLDG